MTYVLAALLAIVPALTMFRTGPEVTVSQCVYVKETRTLKCSGTLPHYMNKNRGNLTEI